MTPKIIWCLWLQGRENAPDLVKRCLAGWERLNPGWELRCLDAATVGRYVDVSRYIDLSSQEVTAASLSDIVRMLLLHEYGGVWIDATLYCNQPLDEWLPGPFGTGFFGFYRPAPERLIGTWFLAAAPGNVLFEKWATRALNYWRGRQKSTDYFWVHHQFNELIATDPDARRAWEAVPRFSADGPRSVLECMYESFSTGVRRVDWTSPVFKLTHRINESARSTGFGAQHVHEPGSTPTAGGFGNGCAVRGSSDALRRHQSRDGKPRRSRADPRGQPAFEAHRHRARRAVGPRRRDRIRPGIVPPPEAGGSADQRLV